MKPPAEGSRAARVAERIRAEMMELLLRGAIKDPGVAGVVVHRVDVSGDLRLARLYVRLGVPAPDARQKKRALAGLERAAGFLRQKIGARLALRHAPELSFYWDDTTETVGRVEAILDELRREGTRGEEE